MKSIFYQSRLLARIRYSPIFIKTWLMLRPAVKKKIRRQKKYYTRLVQNLRMPETVILDIGANEGFVSDIFLNRGLTVVAVEPDPRNIRILQARFQKNRNFALYPCLCSATPGFRSFWISVDNSAYSTGNMKWKNLLSEGEYRLQSYFRNKPEKIQATTMDEIIRVHGKIAFAKIDIEGSELECLQGLSGKIPLLAFEANLPEYAQETISCVLHLSRIDPGAQFSYSSDFNDVMPAPLSAPEFCKIIDSVSNRTIDVICKMSNYYEFYSSESFESP